MESNGSTSMATVCGGTLALLDAGVPIKAPVAGISIGRVAENGRSILLTDILGEEDFHGDMDFKVAGTADGITGIQLDMKARCIPQDEVVGALRKAKTARLHILAEMAKALPAPRAELSRHAPRMFLIHIDPEKIGKVIGPGGKTINRIQNETGAKIDIEDDGRVFVACADAAGAEAAKAEVEGLTAEVELGRIYKGKVVSLTDFGAFVEIMPGQDGLCHVSELSTGFVKRPEDVVKLGEEIEVKVIRIDQSSGKIALSRKVLMAPAEGGAIAPGGDAGQGQQGGRPYGGGGGGGGGRRRGGGRDGGQRRDG
jgi:polyribonucleotide nucleotidyltransferase